jgi:hypothetical protein
LDLGVVKLDSRLKFTLFDRVGDRDELLGDLRTHVRDLVRKPAAVPLVLEDEKGRALPYGDIFMVRLLAYAAVLLLVRTSALSPLSALISSCS